MNMIMSDGALSGGLIGYNHRYFIILYFYLISRNLYVNYYTCGHTRNPPTTKSFKNFFSIQNQIRIFWFPPLVYQYFGRHILRTQLGSFGFGDKIYERDLDKDLIRNWLIKFKSKHLNFISFHLLPLHPDWNKFLTLLQKLHT